MKNVFITGTDTEIGKTYVTCLLLKSLREAGYNAVGYKPIACGDRQDARQMRETVDADFSLEEINPIYLKTPTCPYVAARLENTEIDKEAIIKGFDSLASKYNPVLIEGVGGWEVPLSSDCMLSDLVKEMDLPVILVIGNKLGALNHAILTLNAIKAKGLECLGVIFNNVTDSWDTACVTNRGVIEEVTGLPVLAELIHGQDYLDIDPIVEALS